MIDVGFCHGAAGLAHIYRRLHRASGDRVLGEAADWWLEYCLSLRRDGEGVAGVCRWDYERRSWQADPALLGGAAGVGLGLLTAAAELDVPWDRVYLTALSEA